MKYLSMLLWDTKKQDFQDIKIESNNTLQKLYKYLDCKTIDITSRSINNIYYDIIVDDEGLLKNDHIVSYFENNQPQLVGNLIFSKANDQGENIGLTNKDINNLKENLKMIYYANDENDFIKALNYKRSKDQDQKK